MINTYIAGQIYAKISFETTISQKKVVEKLSEWLSSPDYSQIFVLNGYAGTGKTTLISAVVEVLADMGTTCVLLAPTGRAAKVLSRYAGQEAHTIHKQIYRERTNAQYESKFSLDINKYKDAERNNAEPWDELEKSIIANLADDVIVSVKGSSVEIVILKDFNK